MPAHACDCHAHICGPAAIYPYMEGRLYTPPDALLPDYAELLRNLGIERAVFVQPSIYGADNAAMLDAMRTAPFPNRGVAVLEPAVSESVLADLHEAGIRGVRFNLVDVADPSATVPLSGLRLIAEKIAPLGWHVELQIHIDDHADLDVLFAGFPVDIVFGHIGYPRSDAVADTAGFRALLNLMRGGRCWVKLSGPYRFASAKPPYDEILPVVNALVAAAPQRLVWGSDWPHTNIGASVPHDRDLLNLLGAWVPDEKTRCRILVDNPTALYGF
jgi:predicted TIM-barrel fold metal-dependent hydrolase